MSDRIQSVGSDVFVAGTASGLLCHWLSLAATPFFAAMVLATRGGDMPDMPGMSPLNGMALMYLLMAVFHAAPWLRLVALTRKETR
jgi:hypothetical protein